MDWQDTEYEAFLRGIRPRAPRPLPAIEQVPKRSLVSRRWLVASAAILFWAVVSILIYHRGMNSTHMVLENAQGPTYVISTGTSRLIPIGANVGEGKTVRSDGGAILRLTDGSVVELRSHSEMSLQTARDGMLLQLNSGSIIVNAAKQHNGHLYVRTKDVTVSVVGTVFLVNAEEEGSRVAVIQGEVQVRQGTAVEKLRPGQQIATNPSMTSPPVTEQLSWSPHAVEHIALLQQSTSAAPIDNRVASSAPLQFEVVSIKLPIYPRTTRFACRGIDGTIEPYLGATPSAFAEVGYKGEVREGPLSVPRGRCIGQPDITRLISIAYDVPTFDISGAPRIGGFNIEAKAEDVANVTKRQLRQMLQSMLADRFRLKFHWQTEESPGFALLAGKNGPKLKETSEEEEYPHFVYHPLPPYPLPAMITIKGKSSTKSLADFLGSLMGERAVVDKTGLTGTYEYTLKLRQFPSTAPRGGGSDGGYDPPVPKAAEEQLGLRLQEMKVPTRTIVIDSVEKPSAN